jgi:CheY-like chemotaxis protein
MSDKGHILLLDEDMQLIETLRILLESVGYKVSCVHDLEQGLALAREKALDLVVIDILSAGPSSAGHREEVRQYWQDPALKGTPLLVIGGVKGMGNLTSSLTSDEGYTPIQSVLEKPFKPADFLVEVERLLSLQSTPKQETTGTILVVDDDPDFVQITTRILQQAGHRVMVAASGAQALGAMRQRKPDLVLLDIMMSTILDGLNVSEAMQADPDLRDIPVFLVSSIANTEYASAFPTDASVHMDAWITKPIKPDDLLARIAEHLA